jgi:hypothetical protein
MRESVREIPSTSLYEESHRFDKLSAGSSEIQLVG